MSGVGGNPSLNEGAKVIQRATDIVHQNVVGGLKQSLYMGGGGGGGGKGGGGGGKKVSIDKKWGRERGGVKGEEGNR